MFMQLSSTPLMRCKYSAISGGEHERVLIVSPYYPTEQRFISATSMIRAG